MDLVRRAGWGARPPRFPGGVIEYEGKRRGVKVHYLGAPYENRDHSQCPAYIRGIQDRHMDVNGWSDIGYSFMVCTHGTVYEGRGLRRRNSANGNTFLNNQDYAVLLLVGSSGLTRPTPAQLNGGRDAIDYCRAEGPAGRWVGGHRDGYATECPGDILTTWVRAGAPRPSGGDDMDAQDVWAYVGINAEGDRNAINYLIGAFNRIKELQEDVRSLALVVQGLESKVNELPTRE